jgi:hypothetical protein
MQIRCEIEPPDVLVVHLREGDAETHVAVSPAAAGATSIRRALEAALEIGYGECFWPGRPGGQYWWIFKRDAETLETIAMWTRGGAALWEHVFRATDSAAHVHQALVSEIQRLGV